MAEIIEITNLEAPELSDYTRLTDAQLRSKQRPEEGLFIAESLKVINHALDAGCVPVSLLMEREKLTGQAAETINRCGDIPVYTADRSVLQSLTGYALTRGVLCAMKRPAPRTLHGVLAGARRVAVLEGIVDSTNIGAIFRSAAALSMDAVLLSPTCCDPLSRRAVRVSMGTVFQVPWARIGQSAADWPAKGMADLRAAGFSAVALALTDKSVAIDDPVLKTQDRLAVILGTEGDGLCAETIALSDYTAKIPMTNGVDSLNVAAASAVAFWETRPKERGI